MSWREEKHWGYGFNLRQKTNERRGTLWVWVKACLQALKQANLLLLFTASHGCHEDPKGEGGGAMGVRCPDGSAAGP